MTPEKENNDDEIRIQMENILMTGLAIDIAGGIVTDDNPSTNGKTGVDQYLYFLFDTYSEHERNYLKQKALALAEGFSTGTAEVDDDLIPDMDKLVDIKSEEFLSFKDWIVFLHSAGIITDNNPSKTNGLTGLDQVIKHVFSAKEEDYLLIKEIIISETIKYTGGYRRNSPPRTR